MPVVVVVLMTVLVIAGSGIHFGFDYSMTSVWFLFNCATTVLHYVLPVLACCTAA